MCILYKKIKNKKFKIYCRYYIKKYNEEIENKINYMQVKKVRQKISMYHIM